MPRDPRQNTGGGWPWPASPEKPQSLHTQYTVTHHVGAPPNHLHKPWREVVAGQGSKPVLPAVWTGEIPPIDMLTTIQTYLQEEGNSAHTESTLRVHSLGGRGGGDTPP